MYHCLRPDDLAERSQFSETERGSRFILSVRYRVDSAAENLRAKGIKAGVMRPITVWPFPAQRLRQLAEREITKAFLDVEMSGGQMLDDVLLATGEKKPVRFYGRMGGVIPTVAEVEHAAEAAWKEVSA